MTTENKQKSAYPETVNLPFNFSSIKSDFDFTPLPAELNTEESFWVILQANGAILKAAEGGFHLPYGALPAWVTAKQAPLCIGTWQGKPLRALVIGKDQILEPPYEFIDFYAGNDLVSTQTFTLAGLGKQILHWDRQSRHCSRCGEVNEPMDSGWGKRCRSCSSEHFPHIHPCAIVLVKRGNELLLTRKAEWAEGRYSLVAGFLDFGESLEECAIREVKEETGIDIENVRYVGSQNWPFPAQLMAGFVAEYAGGDIQVDKNELEDARWFPVDAMPLMPGRRSIARWIIDNFK